MTSGSLPDFLGGIALHLIFKVLSDAVMENASSFFPLKKGNHIGDVKIYAKSIQ